MDPKKQHDSYPRACSSLRNEPADSDVCQWIWLAAYWSALADRGQVNPFRRGVWGAVSSCAPPLHPWATTVLQEDKHKSPAGRSIWVNICDQCKVRDDNSWCYAIIWIDCGNVIYHALQGIWDGGGHNQQSQGQWRDKQESWITCRVSNVWWMSNTFHKWGSV